MDNLLKIAEALELADRNAALPLTNPTLEMYPVKFPVTAEAEAAWKDTLPYHGQVLVVQAWRRWSDWMARTGDWRATANSQSRYQARPSATATKAISSTIRRGGRMEQCENCRRFEAELRLKVDITKNLSAQIAAKDARIAELEAQLNTAAARVAMLEANR